MLQNRAQARHAELLARAGISGRHARHALHDLRGLRSRRAQPEILAALGRNTALQARVQGRTNRQTPEWASTHPYIENRMQRAIEEARATGRLGSGIRNRDGFLDRARRHVRRRRSGPGRDRRPELHAPGPAHPVHGAAGLSHVERHEPRSRSQARPARPSSAAASSPDRSISTSCRCTR